MSDDDSEVEAPDVDEYNVEELRAEVRDIEDADVLRAMLADETEGTTRSTAVDAITERIDAVVDESDNTQADDVESESEPSGFSDTVVVRNPAKTARMYANIGRLQPGETTEAPAGAARKHIKAGELQVVTTRTH